MVLVDEMAVQTLTLYSVGTINTFRADTMASLTGDNPISQAVNGNAFSWKNPSDVGMTFGSTNASVTIDSSDGIVRHAPLTGDTVTDQRLSSSTTIDGVTYNPNASTVLWQKPAPVYLRAEYTVQLEDALGNPYTMVGLTMVSGYTPTVIGVAFIGAAPPPGGTLYYRQGVSSFDDTDPQMPVTILCFGGDSQILTEHGPVPAAALQVGMRVLTRDNGLQPIRWISCRDLTAFDRPPRLNCARFGSGQVRLAPGRRNAISLFPPNTAFCCDRKSRSGCSARTRFWFRP